MANDKTVDTDTTENKKTGQLDDRRDTVKKILAISSVAGTAYWTRPVVESVVLPAHAQTTTDDGSDNSRRAALSSLYNLQLSLDASRSASARVSGEISANIVQHQSTPAHDSPLSGIIGTAHASAPVIDDAIANQQIDLIVTLQVNRLFEYYWWEKAPTSPWLPPDSDGSHGPMDYETGEETVRIESKQITPGADGTWTVEFDNTTTFNQSTRNFPPEVNYFTHFVKANNEPQANSETYVVFSAYPLYVSVAFADEPDIPAANGDTFNPYVSPLSFGSI